MSDLSVETQAGRSDEADHVTQQSFCWVRTLDVCKAATTPAARVLVDHCGYSLMYGGRPPPSVATVKQALEEGRPTRSDSQAFWSASKENSGRVGAGTVFDFGPAFDSEAAAVAWITDNPEGQRWDREASNRILMTAGRCALGLSAAARSVSTEMDNEEKTAAPYVFPDSDWRVEFVRAHVPPAKDRLLRNLEAMRCKRFNPDYTPAEYEKLVQLQRAERPTKVCQIRTQAHSVAHVLAPLLEQASIDPAKFSGPLGQKLLAWVTDNVEPVIFINKRSFMRARPMHFADTRLQPMFPKSGPDTLYPGHPSYPSGHATTAHVWAGLLARCGADPNNRLEAIADDIGRNREVAGVHFASDTAAGKDLAQQIVQALFESDSSNPSRDKFYELLKCLGLKPPKAPEI